MKIPGFIKRIDAISLVFIFPCLYWIYLLFHSQMVVVHDAKVYEMLGRMLYTQGWMEFFKTGPHNEPLYPLMIAFSMALADKFHASYQSIQTIEQIGFLFFTQILFYLMLKRLNIHKFIRALVILYFGFSPALVNSALSLWSEIITYPLVLGIIFVSSKAWIIIQRGDGRKILFWAVCFALLFVFLIFAKALFEYLFYIYLLPFILLMMKAVMNKQKKILLASLSFCLIVLSLVLSSTGIYKSINRHYNGHFTLTDRGPHLLYGNVMKRTQPLTLRGFLAFLSWVPGEGVCHKFFDAQECGRWSFFRADYFGLNKLEELEAGLPKEMVYPQLIRLAQEQILKKPFQYIIFTGIEALKMFFWESTRIGFVIYPTWLSNLYECAWFKDGLRFMIFFLTVCAFLFLIKIVWQRRADLISLDENNYTPMFFFMLLFISLSIGLYSCVVTIFPRYAFPLVPLYLIAIAYMAQHFVTKSCK